MADSAGGWHLGKNDQAILTLSFGRHSRILMGYPRNRFDQVRFAARIKDKNYARELA